MIETRPDRDETGLVIFTPEHSARGVVVILLGGSEGGDTVVQNRGRAFVANGYTVLGIPYYSQRGRDGTSAFPGLPHVFAALPVERVESAVCWCAERTGIPTERMALYGFSKGAELALLAATLVGGFGAIIAIAPTDVVWEGWGPGISSGSSSSFSWRGTQLPFVPYEGFPEELARYARGERDARLATPHERGRARHSARVTSALIAVEQCPLPILLAAGALDRAWPSASMARGIADRRQNVGLDTELLILPDCGHNLCGEGLRINSASPTGSADQRGQRLIWEHTLSFLDRHLPASAHC
jgi:uncharacterized protein